MTKCTLITQSRTKTVTAAALADAKVRNRWSNSDAADALGCGEGTIRNRLDADDPKHQMTVHELLRSIQADGPAIANSIVAIVEHQVAPIGCTSVPDALAIASASARCAAELITAAADGIDRDEAVTLLPSVARLRVDLARLEQLLQSIAKGGAPP